MHHVQLSTLKDKKRLFLILRFLLFLELCITLPCRWILWRRHSPFGNTLQGSPVTASHGLYQWWYNAYRQTPVSISFFQRTIVKPRSRYWGVRPWTFNRCRRRWATNRRTMPGWVICNNNINRVRLLSTHDAYSIKYLPVSSKNCAETPRKCRYPHLINFYNYWQN